LLAIQGGVFIVLALMPGSAGLIGAVVYGLGGVLSLVPAVGLIAILAARKRSWVNGNPRCRILLNVDLPDRSVYQATKVKVIAQASISRYQEGRVFPVRVKPGNLGQVIIIDIAGIDRTGVPAILATGVTAARQERMTRKLARYDTPRERLLGVFDVLGESIAEPGFRGCAFVNASAEARPGSAIEQVCDESRAWVRSLFAELGQAAGAADPQRLARQLALLYDGASVGARMDRDPGAAATARTVAVTLVDAATGAASGP
jgi:hypothetical protein